MHAASYDEYKRWTTSGFAKVIDHLSSRYELKVLLSGSSGDIPYNNKILSETSNQIKVINIAGLFKLENLPALLERARIMVTIDTGPMHIAASVDTPDAAIFYHDYTQRFAPYGQESHVVDSASQSSDEAPSHSTIHPLDSIRVEQVIELIDRVMEETTRSV